MLTIRYAQERGHAAWGWLDSWHTFSFGDYHDPAYMGFRALRVINDDRIAPGGGFPNHPHRDMEIITYVVEGALAHQDSLGNGSVIRPGEVQRMSAGTGIVHSEFNHSGTEPVRLLQIWILPEQKGIEPGYEQKQFPASDRQGQLRVVASPDGHDGSVVIHQDAKVYAALLGPGDRAIHALAPGRYAWVQMVRGSARIQGNLLTEGDGAAMSEEQAVLIEGVEAAELLLFDLP